MKEPSTQTPNTLVRQGIEEIILPGKEFTILEIKEELVKKKGLCYGKDYSEGNLSSALYILSNEGILTKPRRGIYKKTESDNADTGSGDCKKETNNGTNNETGKDDPNDNPRNAKEELTYEIDEILEIFTCSKDKIQEISNKMNTALKSVNLCNGITDAGLKQLQTVSDFNKKIAELLKLF